MNNRTYLDAMRAGTSEQHKELDAAVNRHGLTSLKGYKRFLEMHARLLPCVELWLSGQADFASIPMADKRARCSALEHDLHDLEIEYPHTVDVPFLNESTSVIGVSYVLEGSRLGAKYIKSSLARAQVKVPTAFLDHGDEQPMWKSYVQWLSTQQVTRQSVEQAVLSAQHLFAAYADALNKSEEGVGYV